MQTQIQQSSKRNKAAVPFYSPPSRLYGQTPAEIIREARAAVMTTSAVGIRPVFTSRPFTPKEKERRLFGNGKKINSRPPSSFSFRHLQNQECGSRLKLPSIEVVSRRKTYSTSQHTYNLSLDNLMEDYNAEVLEETNSISTEKLPTWKKPHSCPKEGRLMKVASLNELSNPFSDEVTQYGSKVRNSKTSYSGFSLNTSNSFGDFVTPDDESFSQEDSYLNSNWSNGGGDNKISQNYVKSKINEEVTEGDLSSFKDEILGEIPKEERPRDNEPDKATVLDENLLQESQVEENISQDLVTESENLEVSKPKQSENEHIIQVQNCKKDSVAEKSIITGFRSDYLTSLKTGFKNTFFAKEPESVPLEILELYETAKYYENMDKSNEKSTEVVSSVKNNSSGISNIEDYFGPKENVNQQSELKNDKQEKVFGNEKPAGRIEEKPTVRNKLEETEEFVMNNKKRYHVIGDKGSTKEKAYKRWNNKQEIFDDAPQRNTSNDGWDLFWKNSYYRGTDGEDEKVKKETDEDVLRRLVSRLMGLVKIGGDNDDIYQTTTHLYHMIKSNKTALDGKLKADLLRGLYLNADNETPKVVLSLARLLFLMKEENGLSVACKMVFKVARFDTNDHLFLNEEDILELFLEGIGRASPLDSAECCIYSYGALKFLTMNHNILSRILHMGALDLMTLHLKMINTAHLESGNVGEQTQHALFQLTGALRHIAAGEGAVPMFLTTNCIAITCDTLRLFCTNEDVIINISRTMSLLSTDESVTEVLMGVESFTNIIIDLLDQYKENDKIFLRLAYCLGNIVEHSDFARVQLSRNNASLNVLLNVLKIYINKDLEISVRENSGDPDELSQDVVDDIIVKVIRVLANMSMNPIVGSALSPVANEKKSLQLSKLLSVLLMRKDPGITLLATLGCLNNISYYCNTHSSLIDLTQGVLRVLGLPSEECQTEAARVLGNLTRHQEVRDLIYNTGGMDLLIKLLSSQDQEVVKSACGVLVNMMLDSDTRKYFVKAQGIDKLVEVIELFSGDWSLASLATRAIWNSCANDVSSVVKYNNVDHLLNNLANSLEEENWNDGDAAWEEFAAIATDLLEKISSHLDST